MALAYKKGDKVQQIVPVITGMIVGHTITDDDVSYLVNYEDADGETHERWFKEHELEVLK